MSAPIILYSVQSYLAYYINTYYYNGAHYVWCSPFFDGNNNQSLIPNIAYTSNPKTIYNQFIRDITATDRHYTKREIQRNTVGIFSGAMKMLEKDVITKTEFDKIEFMIKQCQEDNIVEYFRPLIYIIPYDLNKNDIRKVEIKDSALPLSDEYIIERLSRDKFDIIDSKGD